jgi:RimJ/RimL family protein N-acetyltransferase
MRMEIGRTVIRAFNRADAAVLARLYRDSDAHQTTTPFWHPWSTEDFERFVSVSWVGSEFRLAVCPAGTSPNDPIGFVELNKINWVHGTAEVGVTILPADQRGKGHGTNAVVAITRWAFSTLRLRRLYAKTFASNKGSQRCFEKAGFVREGIWRRHFFVDGRSEDAILYGVLCEEYSQ